MDEVKDPFVQAFLQDPVMSAVEHVLRQDPDREVREAACELSAALAERTGQLPSLLHEALRWVVVEDPDRFVRGEAVEALGTLARVDDVSLIADRLLHDEADWVREDAAEALEAMGPAAAEALPALEQALSDEDEGVRKAAAEAILEVQPAG